MQPTSWIPLLFVLIVNMVKELIEDAKRKKQDREINNQEVFAIDPSTKDMKKLKWKDIKVGSVLVLMEDDQVPADVIVVATADKISGLVDIDTVQLDGETNLKSKESVEFTHRAITKDVPDGAQRVCNPCVFCHVVVVLMSEHYKHDIEVVRTAPRGAPLQAITSVPKQHVDMMEPLHVECEQPNPELSSFTGKLLSANTTESLTNKQVCACVST